MERRTETLLGKSKVNILGLALLGCLAAAVPFVAAGGTGNEGSMQAHGGHDHFSSAKLVQVVRDNTKQFSNVSGATAAGYQQFLGCVSGPDHGAMGQHYVNLSLYGDGQVDETKPEALIYEPSDGGMQLVGVEYIVDSAAWLANHNNSPPVLEGQTFQFVASPNRYALPSFFELHVWAWRENPNGAFVDWNNHVSCEGE